MNYALEWLLTKDRNDDAEQPEHDIGAYLEELERNRGSDPKARDAWMQEDPEEHFSSHHLPDPARAHEKWLEQVKEQEAARKRKFHGYDAEGAPSYGDDSGGDTEEYKQLFAHEPENAWDELPSQDQKAMSHRTLGEITNMYNALKDAGHQTVFHHGGGSGNAEIHPDYSTKHHGPIYRLVQHNDPEVHNSRVEALKGLGHSVIAEGVHALPSERKSYGKPPAGTIFTGPGRGSMPTGQSAFDQRRAARMKELESKFGPRGGQTDQTAKSLDRSIAALNKAMSKAYFGNDNQTRYTVGSPQDDARRRDWEGMMSHKVQGKTRPAITGDMSHGWTPETMNQLRRQNKFDDQRRATPLNQQKRLGNVPNVQARQKAGLVKGFLAKDEDVDPAVAELMGWGKKKSDEGASGDTLHQIDQNQAKKVREINGDGWLSPEGDLYQVPSGQVHTSVFPTVKPQDYTPLLRQNWVRVVSHPQELGVHGHERNLASMRNVIARHTTQAPNRRLIVDIHNDEGKHSNGYVGNTKDWLESGRPMRATGRSQMVFSYDLAKATRRLEKALC